MKINGAEGLPVSILGLSVDYDANCKEVAEACGIWPVKRIRIGPLFAKFPPRVQTALLLHEAKHCQALHFESRMALLILAALPAIYFIPWQITASVVFFMLVYYLAGDRIAHEQEFAADAFATKEGYGEEMIRVLMAFGQAGKHADPFHPSNEARIARITQMLKEKSHATA